VPSYVGLTFILDNDEQQFGFTLPAPIPMPARI